MGLGYGRAQRSGSTHRGKDACSGEALYPACIMTIETGKDG